MADPADGFGDYLRRRLEVRSTDRGGKNRCFTPVALARLDQLIQTEIVQDEACEGVMQLCADHLHVNISKSTAGRALHKLGYRFGKLKATYRLISKRRRVIEAFLRQYSELLKAQDEGTKDLRHLAATDLEKAADKLGFDLLFTPPYNPRFQPIELFWRDSKNFAARECRRKRRPKEAAGDLIDFWYGTRSYKKRRKEVSPFSAPKARGFVETAHEAMKEWIKPSGVRFGDHQCFDLGFNQGV
eukprot:m.82306 g.82306  ORF g.82306 m.82306 type:complete len:243 (-) comp11086_c0_seq1:170-898(-)